MCISGFMIVLCVCWFSPKRQRSPPALLRRLFPTASELRLQKIRAYVKSSLFYPGQEFSSPLQD